MALVWRRWSPSAGIWASIFFIGGLFVWFFHDIDLAIPVCNNARWDCDAFLQQLRRVGGIIAVLVSGLFLALNLAARGARRDQREWESSLQDRLVGVDAAQRDAFLRDWGDPEGPIARLRPVLFFTIWANRVLLAAIAGLLFAALDKVDGRGSGLVVQWQVLPLLLAAMIFLHRSRLLLRVLRTRHEELNINCEEALQNLRGEGRARPGSPAPTFRPWMSTPTASTGVKKS